LQEPKRKWLPSYNTIFLLSAFTAIMVTATFFYFFFSFLQAEKTLSRQSRPPAPNKNAIRVLVTPGIKIGKNPLEAGLLSYLSNKLGRKVVSIQRRTAREAETIVIQKKFDIALTSEKTSFVAEQNNYAEPLVVPVIGGQTDFNSPILVREDLDRATMQKLIEIFLSMRSDRAGKKLLPALGVEDFVKSE